MIKVIVYDNKTGEYKTYIFDPEDDITQFLIENNYTLVKHEFI